CPPAALCGPACAAPVCTAPVCTPPVWGSREKTLRPRRFRRLRDFGFCCATLPGAAPFAGAAPAFQAPAGAEGGWAATSAAPPPEAPPPGWSPEWGSFTVV